MKNEKEVEHINKGLVDNLMIGGGGAALWLGISDQWSHYIDELGLEIGLQ